MNTKLLAIVAAAGLGLYLVLRPKGGAAAVQSGQKNSGIGGAFNTKGGVSSSAVGSIASSFANLTAALFPRGSGTHSPVDTTVKPGTGLGSIVTNYDQVGASGAAIPSPSTIQTQIDGYDPNASYFTSQEPDVSPADFSSDSYWSD